MMDFLRFAFTDGWHFAGVIVLILVLGAALAQIVGAARGRR